MNDRRLRWGATCLALIVAATLLAPLLAPRDPAVQPDGLVLRELPPLSRVDAIRLSDGALRYAHEVRVRSDGALEYRRGARWHRIDAAELAPSWHLRPLYLLGTDQFGRDLLSRLLHGGRVSLAVGLLSAALALLIGTTVGLSAGLAGGWLDSLLMRLTDIVLAVPRLFLALMLVAIYQASLTTTVLVLGATTWMTAARLVRGEVLSLREREFIQAARAAGLAPHRLGLFHLLPAAIAPVIVEAALRVGDTILLEASLSFLGLGVQPPLPSWGNLIADGRGGLLDAWWISTFPGLAIAATVIALNLLGDVASERFAARKRS